MDEKLYFELVDNVVQWGKEKGLVPGNKHSQCLKFIEEYYELSIAIDNDDIHDIIDAIGDCMVTLILLCELHQNNVWAPDVYVGSIKNKILELVSNVLRGMDCDSETRDIIAYLDSVAKDKNLKLEKCLLSAYNTIKDRKGKLVNDCFVKDDE